MSHAYPAPAKLNLFLHVVGRRADGYHLLQSVFRLIDRADTVHLTLRDDGRVVHEGDLPGEQEDHDLTVRAARLLQAHAPDGAVSVRRWRGDVVCIAGITITDQFSMNLGFPLQGVSATQLQHQRTNHETAESLQGLSLKKGA